jgi:hypothetical protein
MQQTDTGELTRAQYYDRIRSQIEHEDELINLRVVWQLLAQSFFFSTYATLLNAQKEAKNVVFAEEQQVLLWLMPIAALPCWSPYLCQYLYLPRQYRFSSTSLRILRKGSTRGPIFQVVSSYSGRGAPTEACQHSADRPPITVHSG